jgi:hypothetical protein
VSQQYFESVLAFSIAGNYGCIVQHWGADITSGATAFESAKELADAFEAANPAIAFLEEIILNMGADCFISSNRVRRINLGGGATYVRVYGPTDWAGQLGTNIDAAQVSGCMLTFPGGANAFHGRNFYPGVAQESLVDGRWVAAYKTQASALGTSYLLGMPGATNTFLPYLRRIVAAVETFNLITNTLLSATPGTIRRRTVPI